MNEKDIKAHMTKPEMVTITVPVSHVAVAFNAMVHCGQLMAQCGPGFAPPADDFAPNWSDHEKAALLQAIHEFHKILDAHKVGKKGN